jgi:cell division protein FtsL
VTHASSPERAPRPAPSSPRERHLAVVDPAARKRERRARMGVRLAVACVVAAVLIVVGFHVMMAEGQLQLDRLDRETAIQQQRYEALRLEFAEQSAPEAIIERAEDLGMVPATSMRYLSAPGLTAEAAKSAGTDATAASLRRDWEKVKPNLVAQP